MSCCVIFFNECCYDGNGLIFFECVVNGLEWVSLNDFINIFID